MKTTRTDRSFICLIWLTAVCWHGLVRTGFGSDIERHSQEVPFQRLFAVMQLQTGYDLTATTNAARFHAGVLLYLVRQTMHYQPKITTLLISHDVWFKAFLATLNLPESEAPDFSKLGYEHQQDIRVDFDQAHVVRKVLAGPAPKMAVNVLIQWQSQPGFPSKYTFEDTLSKPKLRITNHRVISYRLLDFGDMIVYDEIRGLTGRPKDGLLAALFRVIGDGRIVQSRFLIKDGLQMSWVRAKKGLFGTKTLLTVKPNGEMLKGLPKNRPDLIALERKLKGPLKIQYYPL